MKIQSESAAREWVHTCVKNTPIFDMHTHLFAPCFGDLLRISLDETITYHYLVEEMILATGMSPGTYWALPKPQQAELVFKTLFVDRLPVSESCRTILSMIEADGLDTDRKDLDYFRNFYAGIKRDQYIDTVFKRENITGVFMTNDPFDKVEAGVWLDGDYRADDRFYAALRLDELLFFENDAAEQLNAWGYIVERTDKGTPTKSSLPEIRRFLNDWITKMDARYCAASLPVSFSLEDGSACACILSECVLTVCRERKLPVALMLGVTRNVHPAMRDAGDSLGKVDIKQLHKLFREHRENLFFITMLVRENQHEMTATARIFSNVMLFGCWWFLNNPVFMEEMVRMRYEMLGAKFVAQHSDANMLGHLVGKWKRFKTIFECVLTEYYTELISMGYHPDDMKVREEIEDLFGGYYFKFLERPYQP